MREGTPIALRILATLKLNTFSASQLSKLLCCDVDSVRVGLKKLSSLDLVEKRVRITPERGGPVWLYGLAL